MTAQRRLAAIPVADVVGYSRLVGQDEAGTLASLSALRREVIEPTIARHAGRLFKSVGDGFLVEFASAVQAVTAARAIQEANAGGGLPLRIGIHVGDVVVQGDDLMGDGVNIAARIEGVAEAGGIAISRAVHEQVRDKLYVPFVDKGEVALKNLARPVQVFALGGVTPLAAVDPAPVLTLPDKPSIAVLPFQNMSGDPEQEYFVDGLVDEIITALSRFKSLFVIARNSSFTYKGKAVDIKQVGRELGVRYVLEGSMRKGGGKIRISGQLIDAGTGAHLWADRFDGSLEDVFDLQDRVTTSIVGAISPTLDKAEVMRASRTSADDPDAYDCYLRGLAEIDKGDREAWEKARTLFYRAIELDPGFAAAHAMAARCYLVRVVAGWVKERTWEEAETRRLALKISTIGRDDALALATAGHALVVVCREYETGEAMLDRAIELNPNLSRAWHLRGMVSLINGETEAALDPFAKALRLSPLDPEKYFSEGNIAFANIYRGRYDDAVQWANKALSKQPNWLVAIRALTVAHALAGNLDEARKFASRMRALNPAASISQFRSFSTLRKAEHVERVAEGLRLAGLPE